MAERKRTGSKPKLTPVTDTDADVERLLDSIDQALTAGNPIGVPAMVEQLWTTRRRLLEVITRRIIAGRAQIPAFAFDLLGGFAGSKTPTYLRRIADDPNVQDIVRWGARRRAGWPERGEKKKRLAFLDTLEDAESTLLIAVVQAGANWPPDSEILEEALGYLLAMPAARRRAVIERIVAEAGEASAWLLHALLHIADTAAQRTALSALTRSRRPSAAGPIQRLAATTHDAGVRAEAGAALQRLRLQIVQPHQTVDAEPLPEVERVLTTMIDGSGGQAILIIRRWAEGLYLVADMLHNDTWGVKNAFGSYRAPADKVDDVVSGFEDQGMDLVEVDLAWVRGVMGEAVRENAATGHPIPPMFELWEPYVHDTYPPAADEAAGPTELDDTPYAGRRALLKAGDGLADHAFFSSWGFDEAEMAAAMEVTPPPSGGRLTDRQYRPLMDSLVNEERRALFRRRLRRQALLLDRMDDTAARDTALAIAATLTTATPAELAKQPFWRRIVERSLFFAMLALPDV